MRVSDYEYNENVDGKVSQERGEELIDEIQMVIKKDSVPHFEILKIGKNDEEFEFLYNYLEENNISIRGIDITAEAIEGFKRVSKQGVNYYDLPEAMDASLQQQLFQQIEEIKNECRQKGTDFSKDKRYLEVKDKIWTGNLRLARYIANFKAFQLSNKSQDELASYGYEAIGYAIDKFDSTRGYKFSTYAWKVIYGKIERGIATEYGVNQNQYIEFKQMQDTRRMFIDEIGREPSIEELRNILGFTSSKIEDFLALDKISVSYDSLEENVYEEETDIEQAINDFYDSDDYIEYGDGLYINGDGEILNVDKGDGEEYEAEENVQKNADLTFMKKKVEQVLETLTPREAEVLRMRFGLRDGSPKTLEEVGYEIRVTRERVRQIEAKALRKLRHPSRSKQIKDF